MAKEEESWKDTNVGGIGTDEDKSIRKNAASTETAWEGVGMEPGLNVWRIEHFTVVSVDPSSYGKFHKGDSYIILSTVADPDSGKLHRTVHFFLGSETSIDEKGTAAYKTVELDDFFDGEPVEKREPMGEESEEFKALFEGGLEYLEGGVDSGFKHVKPEGHDTQLLVFRRHKSKMKEFQAPLRKTVINDNDSFVLNAPDAIYVYNGQAASNFEKAAANAKAENIENERPGSAEVVLLTAEDDCSAFYALLGE